MAYQIFTDACTDLSPEQRKEYNIEVLRMGLMVNGKEYHADIDYKEYAV